METSSGRLATAALERARAQIAAIGESAAWDRWQHDQIVWRLAEGPDANPQSLLLAGYMLVSPRPGRLEEAAWLAGRYVVGALLLVLTRHGQPHCSSNAKGGLLAGGLGLGTGDGDQAGNGNGAPEAADGGGDAGGDALAKALAALGAACDEARTRPAVLRELRRLHHGLAQVRGAVIQGERAAVRRARRARQAGLRAGAGAGSPTWGGRATTG